MVAFGMAIVTGGMTGCGGSAQDVATHPERIESATAQHDARARRGLDRASLHTPMDREAMLELPCFMTRHSTR
jgi:hypothetical protein